MSYRDDLQAAHEKIHSLEGELRAMRVSKPGVWGVFLRLLGSRIVYAISACKPVGFVAAGVGALFSLITAAFHFFSGPCEPRDKMCMAVRAWPAWAHVLLLWPLLVPLAVFVVITWRDAVARTWWPLFCDCAWIAALGWMAWDAERGRR